MKRAIGKWIQIGLVAALPAGVAFAQTDDTRTDVQKQGDQATTPNPMNSPSDIDSQHSLGTGSDTQMNPTTKPSDTNPTNDTSKPGDINKLNDDTSNKLN